MDKATVLQVSRRLVPFLLLSVLIPTCALLLLIGWGKSEAKHFWKEMYGK